MLAMLDSSKRRSRTIVTGLFAGEDGTVWKKRTWDDIVKKIFVVMFVMVLTSQVTLGSANIMGEECDWFGSGLSSPDGPSRGVTPVYLRCSQGHLDWVYPRGALRVLLRLGASGREFRGCIKVSAEFGGARVFLEGPRSLVPLFAPQDGASMQRVRCFQSRGSQAALYVEAAQSGDFTKQVASITYDLEALPRGGSVYDQTQECRPCTKEEMAHAYCTSDLVARGIIRNVESKYELEVSEVTVKVTKLLRHSTEDNNLSGSESDTNAVSEDGEGVSEVSLQVPSHCGARHGTGEFVFMARRKLGDLTLSCAPRLEDWVDIVRRVNKDGTAHCVLRS